MPDIFTPTTTNTQPDTAPTPIVAEPPVEHHFHALASFCENPGTIAFETQEPDEKILLFLRRHFITNVPWIITTIFFLLLPFILNAVFIRTDFSFSFIPSGFITVVVVFYYLIVFAYAFTSFLTWFYNISFVT